MENVAENVRTWFLVVDVISVFAVMQQSLLLVVLGLSWEASLKVALRKIIYFMAVFAIIGGGSLLFNIWMMFDPKVLPASLEAIKKEIELLNGVVCWTSMALLLSGIWLSRVLTRETVEISEQLKDVGGSNIRANKFRETGQPTMDQIEEAVASFRAPIIARAIMILFTIMFVQIIIKMPNTEAIVVQLVSSL